MQEKMRGMLNHYAQSMGVDNQEDREDLIQETLIDAWKTPWVPGKAKLSTWLIQILKNTVMNFWEGRNRFKRRMDRQAISLDEMIEANARGIGWSPEPRAKDNVEEEALDALWLDWYESRLGDTNKQIAHLMAMGYCQEEAAHEAGLNHIGGRALTMRKQLRRSLNHREM